MKGGNLILHPNDVIVQIPAGIAEAKTGIHGMPIMSFAL